MYIGLCNYSNDTYYSTTLRADKNPLFIFYKNFVIIYIENKKEIKKNDW